MSFVLFSVETRAAIRGGSNRTTTSVPSPRRLVGRPVRESARRHKTVNASVAPFDPSRVL
jgi:hypothetical protein